MNGLVVSETTAAQWHALVSEINNTSGLELNATLESYLVGLLMRYTERPELASSIIALEYLQALELKNYQGYEQLREIGDQCLLFSGLFPARASRRRVRVSYFVKMGQNAYAILGYVKGKNLAAMFDELSHSFVQLMDVLFIMQQMAQQKSLLSVLDAFELWQDTGSSAALRMVEDYSSSAAIIPAFSVKSKFNN